MTDYSKMYLVTQSDYTRISHIKNQQPIVPSLNKKEQADNVPPDVAVKMLNVDKPAPSVKETKTLDSAGIQSLNYRLLRDLENTMSKPNRTRTASLAKHIINVSEDNNISPPWGEDMKFNNIPNTNIIDLLNIVVTNTSKKYQAIPTGLDEFLSYLTSINTPETMYGNFINDNFRLKYARGKRRRVDDKQPDDDPFAGFVNLP